MFNDRPCVLRSIPSQNRLLANQFSLVPVVMMNILRQIRMFTIQIGQIPVVLNNILRQFRVLTIQISRMWFPIVLRSSLCLIMSTIKSLLLMQKARFQTTVNIMAQHRTVGAKRWLFFILDGNR